MDPFVQPHRAVLSRCFFISITTSYKFVLHVGRRPARITSAVSAFFFIVNQLWATETLFTFKLLGRDILREIN